MPFINECNSNETRITKIFLVHYAPATRFRSVSGANLNYTFQKWDKLKKKKIRQLASKDTVDDGLERKKCCGNFVRNLLAETRDLQFIPDFQFRVYPKDERRLRGIPDFPSPPRFNYEQSARRRSS